MQVTIEVDPKFVPEGYEAVACRTLREGDEFVDQAGKICRATAGDGQSALRYPWLIIRPVRQWHQVTEENVVDVLKNWKQYDLKVRDHTGTHVCNPLTIQSSGVPYPSFRQEVCVAVSDEVPCLKFLVAKEGKQYWTHTVRAVELELLLYSPKP